MQPTKQSEEVIRALVQPYLQQAPQPQNNIFSVAVVLLACFLIGLAIGSISVYQNPTQQVLRQTQQRAKQLQKLQQELCN
jgi:hypothetical protein